ncbi:hypothetical protein K6119_18455 [Paracrocinitomix mangrovi]|uniref:hypothetical protein n=1 Tax=Paracrocinitomix mangrovi TaxID=2862509 RepID=UPI001C8F0ED8|nr:hypothetical protein [Paracrocinitomix mangrovi]UKN01709.1 hypothetical protein K6119_18455 [Paracrocinitomix mangrovi]
MKSAIIILLISIISLSLNAQMAYKLVEKPDEGSCFNYDIEDEKGKLIKLPKHIRESLLCPYSVGLNGNFLTYVDGLKVKLYNLKTKEDHQLFTLYEDIDGFSFPAWSKSGKEVMFVIINQQMKHDYKSMCRIIYLKLNDNGSIESKRKFDRAVNFDCGSVCSSMPGTDFMFDEKGNIKFKIHWSQSEDEEKFETIEL